MSTKRLTLEEKVKIVLEAEQDGFTEVALKYGISSRQLYRWRDKIQKGGSSALSYGAKIDPELKALKEENLRLKKLVANQALDLEIKGELLKNFAPHREKVLVAKLFIDKGYMKKQVCKSLQIRRNLIYYRSKENKPGRKPTQYTWMLNEKVDELKVITSIKVLLDHEYISYGYLKITKQLNRDGFEINKKKVYRLMRIHKLSKPQLAKTSGKRNFIRFRKPQVDSPLTYFEMDIKYIYIPAERRNAYLLSVIDVFSRKVVGHVFKRSVRKIEVINLWQSLQSSLGDFKKITLRTDNGSQFIANDVRGFFHYKGINHEFTNIATPEDDGQIEAFHSILEREFLKRNDYITFDETKSAIAGFMKCYNQERLHGSLNYKTPDEFIIEFNKNNFFKGKEDKNLPLLSEANLGGTSKLENINQNNQLCQNVSDLSGARTA